MLTTRHGYNILRCDQCGEVIGVYEPLIVVRGGEPVETSRAADGSVSAEPGEHFHRSCYAERGETFIG